VPLFHGANDTDPGAKRSISPALKEMETGAKRSIFPGVTET